MLAVSVEFLHGTFRADGEGAANTGRLTRGEWPLAPSRLFAALVAADGTGQRCRVTDGEELEWFERLPPPIIHAHPEPWHQVLQPRYVVRHEGTASKSTHQEYVGRVGALIRPGVRVAPRYPQVVYAWNESPPETTLEALRRRAARIGYLGAADSPVRVRVMTRMPESAILEDAFTPDARGNVMITVSGPGDVRILDKMYDAWCEHGADIGRGQYPALRHEAPYRSPRSAAPSESGVVAWLLLGTVISGRRVSPVTALFKEARPQQAPKHPWRSASGPARPRIQRGRLRDCSLPGSARRRVPAFARTDSRSGALDAARVRHPNAQTGSRCCIRRAAVDRARRRCVGGASG